MKAVRAWNQPNPFLLPGNRQKTGPGDQFPINCIQIAKFTDGKLLPVSTAPVRNPCDVAR